MGLILPTETNGPWACENGVRRLRQLGDRVCKTPEEVEACIAAYPAIHPDAAEQNRVIVLTAGYSGCC